MRYRNQGGFTLVELLVVVTIISLLAVFAVPKAVLAIAETRQARVSADLSEIQKALERHYTDLGYYPVKLNDLKTRGYLKRQTTFKHPISHYYYFYAVDDNRNDAYGQATRAQAYALGAPGRDASPNNHLYHGGPLPRGYRPDHRARAWLHYDSGQGLNLYAPDDSGLPLGANLPAQLGRYRTSCQSGSSSPCDLITN